MYSIWNVPWLQVHLRSLFLASLAGAGFLLGTEIFCDAITFLVIDQNFEFIFLLVPKL